MSLNLDVLETTLLDKKVHHREAFTCGKPSLDDYLKRQAQQDAKRGAARPYVLIQPDKAEEIIGYFTLSALSVVLDELPEGIRTQLARYPEVPAILVGRLAVSLKHQGQGVGGELLRRVLLLCVEIADSKLAASIIVVDAIDEAAANFYLKYGFEAFDTDSEYPQRFFIPVKTVRESLSKS